MTASGRTYKLVVVESHPIQYKAPLFRLLAADPRFDLTVLYAMIPDQLQQGEGFGVSFVWDIPLLSGYKYEVLENRSANPSVLHFRGCDTPGIAAVLEELKPDAVLVNGWVVKSCIQALQASRKLGIPCLVRCEANLLRPRAWWKHVIHRLLLSRFQAYLYIGSANADFYRFHRRPSDRLFFAPYAVDNAWFQREAESRVNRRGALRSSYGIGTDAVTFLFCGKLEEKKRPADIFYALGSLPVAVRDRAHVLVVGDGPLRQSLESLASECGLRTTFAGFHNQSRLPDAYAASDVLVLPSDSGETWGLVVNEAMASGRPAVVSRAAGCSADLVVEGKTGYSYECGDTTALSDVMNRYLECPALATEQGVAARNQISRYDFDRICDGLAAALDRTVRRPSGEVR